MKNVVVPVPHSTNQLGADWVANLGVDVVELLDLKLDPVRVVAASPNKDILTEDRTGKRPLIIASEYEMITTNWIKERGLNATLLRTFGATESFPPDDADLIVDNTATGSTLKANGLHIIETVMHSTTRLFAHAECLKNPIKKRKIDQLVLLLKAALAARNRIMVEFNVPDETIVQQIVKVLPCMRSPTVATLQGGGFALKICCLRSDIAEVLPNLARMGAQDIVVYKVQQVISNADFNFDTPSASPAPTTPSSSEFEMVEESKSNNNGANLRVVSADKVGKESTEAVDAKTR